MKKRVKNSDIKKFIEEQFQLDVELDVDKALENVKERMELSEDNNDDSEPLHPIYTFPRKKFCTISICSLIGTFLCGGAISGAITFVETKKANIESNYLIHDETEKYLYDSFDYHDNTPSLYLSLNDNLYFSLIKAYKNNGMFYNYEFYSKIGIETKIQILSNQIILTEFQMTKGVVYSVIDLTPNTIYQITVFSDQEYSAFFSVC